MAATDTPSPAQLMEILRLLRVRGENRFFYHLCLWATTSFFAMAVGALGGEGPLEAAPLIYVWLIALVIHGFVTWGAGRGRYKRRLGYLEAEIQRQAEPSASMPGSTGGSGTVGSPADAELAELRTRLTRAAEDAREAVRAGGGQAVADVARGESLGLSIVAWLEEARHLLRRGREIGELRQKVVDSLSRPGSEAQRSDLRRLLGQLDARDVKLAALEREAARRQSALESFVLVLDSAGLARAKGDLLAAVTKPISERLNLLESVVAPPAAEDAGGVEAGDPADRRIEKEVLLARDLQRSILPSEAPAVPGLSVAHLYRPSSEVGGDFFDFYATGGDRLLVAVGDASGHGLDSSMVSSMAKSALYTQVSAGHSLEESMSELNRMMFDTLGHRRLMTLALVEFDPTARRLSWVNAGQVFPLLRRGGRVRELEQPSYPLGVRAQVRYQASGLELEPGDLLLLLSDGLVEATDAGGGTYGWERLGERLGDLAGAEPAGLIETLEADLQDYLGGRPLEDDVTLVAIGFEP
ncbi:MAG: PP2C family protein-serine/threonine phosphatase [Thermoanaerobaculia bacterium]